MFEFIANSSTVPKKIIDDLKMVSWKKILSGSA